MSNDYSAEYVVSARECSLNEIRNYRSAAVEKGIERAINKRIASTRGELVVRPILPFTDLGQGAVGWAIEDFRNPAIAAAGWGSVFDTGALPAFCPQLPVDRVLVIYKWANYTANPTMIGVRFRMGQTGASTLFSFVCPLIIGAKMEPDVYFTEPVVYNPQDFVYIEGYYNAAIGALGENFAFEGFVIERLGANIS